MKFDPFGDFAERGYLRNFAGAKDTELIKKMEHVAFARNCAKAAAMLQLEPEITIESVHKTHQILFGGVYPWAGQDRSQTGPKSLVHKGPVTFMPVTHFADGLSYTLQRCTDPSHIRHKPGEVMGDLAYAHPFLDGNGRTIMLIHGELCRRAGIHINWSQTNKIDYLNALTAEINAAKPGQLDNYLEPYVKEGTVSIKTAASQLVDLAGLSNPNELTKEKSVQTSATETMLHSVSAWPVGIAATVEAKLKSDRSITHAHTSVAERLRYIYVKPDDALKALQLDRFTNLAGDERAKAQEQLGSSLEQDPVRFGQIHGKAGTFVSKAAKQQRADALGHVPVLVKDINNYLRVHSMALEKEKAVVEQDRKQSQVNIPALSKAAADTLMKVRAAIDAGKPDEALAIASADKGVKAELDGLNKAVTSRFGESAFLHSAAAEGKALDAVKGRIGGDQLQKLTDAWPTLHAAQKLAAAQRTDKQIQSQKQAQAQSQGQKPSK